MQLQLAAIQGVPLRGAVLSDFCKSWDASEAAINQTPTYVKLPKFQELTGYTPQAVKMKISEGVWLAGHEYVKAPDGHLLVSLEGYARWAEGRRNL